jgi:TolB-like protein/Flp pilus assembly protein TadD
MFRVALFYAVGAWGVIAVCDVLFPQLPQWVSDPDAGIRIVFIAAIAIFPLVLLLGWLYDITADGIQRTADFSDSGSDADTSLHAVDRWIIGGLSSIALAIVAVSIVRIDALPPPGPHVTMTSENSIAVMPFAVCAGDEGSVLAAGLATEVINRLAERGKLKVLARVSSFALAGSDLPPAKIAEPLGVQYVLTGILCSVGNRLTLSAELYDQNGFIVWSDSYEQTVTSSGQITRNLATAVATRVAEELGDVLPARPDTPVNKLAYEQLVIGREHRARGDDERARAAFERALDKQPDLAEAVYEKALLELGPSISLKQGTGVANAKPIAEHALELVREQLEYDALDSNKQYVAGRIIAALAYMEQELLWRRSGDLDDEVVTTEAEHVGILLAEAEQHFRTSININPTSTPAYYRLARVVEDQGRASEALEILERAHIRDPFNIVLNGTIAKRWAARGRFRQAIELLERFEDLPEVPAGSWWWRLELMTLQTHWDEKCATLIEMLLNNPEAFDARGNRWQAWWFASQLAFLGLYEEAEIWKESLEHMPMNEQLREIGLQHYMDAIGEYEVVATENQTRLSDMTDEEVLDAFHETGMAWVSDLADAGDSKRAIELLESIQHAPAIWAEREAWAPMMLAVLYKQVGREDEAAPVLAGIAEKMEAEFDDGIRHPDTLISLAEIYALQNRDELAIDMMEKAVDYHMLDDCSTSIWEQFKDNARVAALCKRMAAEIERQAESIRAMLAEHDFDELLAPLMALAQSAD